MKNKIIFALIFCLFIPTATGAYYSSEQFRLDMTDYVRDYNQRQQFQDILDTQNRSYDQMFDTYNQTTRNLERGLDLELKELELKEAAEARAEAWAERKALLDQQLELIREKRELEAQKGEFEKQKGSNILKASQEALGEIEAERGSSSEIKKIFDKYKTTDGLPVYIPTTGSDSEIDDYFNNLKKEDVPVPAPSKNIFYRFWESIISIF